MLRKLAITGLAAGAALSAVLSTVPAHASTQANNNLQVLPIQFCNANVGAVIGFAVPIASPQTTKNCTNGPVNTNVDVHHKKKHHGHY
ncbi:hypothetical protein HNR23_005152 [Nocardiopsis mwathae]|uniref:Chaplin n=1 Tax=Nocardiopsis mwathae TaxID=1472723 RepID=A0A7W9YMU4_9ACTN|nr:hypothetical protein [Nocardiopsis mwathae]MBB6175092.1 hypothetical protein [Nocardiopsis mwathae]